MSVLPVLKTASRSCICPECVKMCEHRPCWGTPEDIEKIITAGFGAKLMVDWWSGGGPDGEDIKMLAPAIVGHEGGRAPSWPSGRCTFLVDSLCSLHTLGLKPYEGRVALCDGTENEDLHEQTAMTWNNPEAQQMAVQNHERNA